MARRSPAVAWGRALVGWGVPWALLIGLSGPAAACALPPRAEVLVARLHATLDAERRRVGLPGLRSAAALDRVAQAHACDNAARGRMSHVGSDGSRLGDRLRRSGYRLSTAIENLAQGFSDPAAVAAAWMGSPVHRRNVLAAQVAEVGIAVARGADGRLYWVMKAASR